MSSTQNNKETTMARFRQTAPYCGKGLKDQVDRAKSLIARGLLPPGNYRPGTPGARKAVTKAEDEAGLQWHSGAFGVTRGHHPRQRGAADQAKGQALPMDPNGLLYAGPIPASLLPARTDSGALLAIQHPQDGMYGVPVLTATNKVMHYAAGTSRTLPPETVRQIRLGQLTRLATWDNCSFDQSLAEEHNRWKE